MRNVFDQYNAPENRLTHALGCCLQRDRRLLRAFVRWATGRRDAAWGQLAVLEQQVPGLPISASNDDKSGLPDLWIHSDGDWSLIIESKVMAKVSVGQLSRHKSTARRNGFTDIDLVVLAPYVPSLHVRDVKYLTWPQLYCWLRQQARESTWAACMTDYMEVAEARMTTEGYLGDHAITEFDGIPFGLDHPFTYREGKRVLRLALAELRKRRDLRKLGMDPNGKGRPAITGRDGTSVWDFLPLLAAREHDNFTSCPHLTLSIQSLRLVVIVTLPNAVPARMRANLTELGVDKFMQLIGEVEAGVRKVVRHMKDTYAFMEVIQRHYPSQRSAPVTDARLEFDLQTVVGARRSTSVRMQPQWLEAAFRALAAKRSNLQIGIGAVFPYGDRRLHSPDVLDAIAGVWIGCRPWIKKILS